MYTYTRRQIILYYILRRSLKYTLYELNMRRELTSILWRIKNGTLLDTSRQDRSIQFDRSILYGKRGTVVEYLIVVPKIVGSRPSAAAFEIFQLCRSYFASPSIPSGVFYETSLE